MIRTLPFRMHRKECEILVEAAYSYYDGTKYPGEAVIAIWSVYAALKDTLLNCYDIKSAVNAILDFQKLRPINY